MVRSLACNCHYHGNIAASRSWPFWQQVYIAAIVNDAAYTKIWSGVRLYSGVTFLCVVHHIVMLISRSKTSENILFIVCSFCISRCGNSTTSRMFIQHLCLRHAFFFLSFFSGVGGSSVLTLVLLNPYMPCLCKL